MNVVDAQTKIVLLTLFSLYFRKFYFCTMPVTQMRAVHHFFRDMFLNNLYNYETNSSD